MKMGVVCVYQGTQMWMGAISNVYQFLEINTLLLDGLNWRI